MTLKKAGRLKPVDIARAARLLTLAGRTGGRDVITGANAIEIAPPLANVRPPQSVPGEYRRDSHLRRLYRVRLGGPATDYDIRFDSRPSEAYVVSDVFLKSWKSRIVSRLTGPSSSSSGSCPSSYESAVVNASDSKTVLRAEIAALEDTLSEFRERASIRASMHADAAARARRSGMRGFDQAVKRAAAGNSSVYAFARKTETERHFRDAVTSIGSRTPSKGEPVGIAKAAIDSAKISEKDGDIDADTLEAWMRQGVRSKSSWGHIMMAIDAKAAIAKSKAAEAAVEAVAARKPEDEIVRIAETEISVAPPITHGRIKKVF